MGTFTFILTQLIYLIFLIILVNTIKKHLFTTEHKKILNTHSNGFFIPENPTYNELYIKNLSNEEWKLNKFQGIAILPYSDKLVSKNGLYDLFYSHYKNEKILDSFLPKTFDLHNALNKRNFEIYIYNELKLLKNIPKVFFLKKNIENKKGITIFRLKKKEDVIELYNKYFNDNYVILQELPYNLDLKSNRIQILRVYIFFYKSKFGYSLGIYRFNWAKLLYPENDFNINDDKSLISKSVEKLKNDLDFDYNFKNQSNQDNILGEKIDKIIEKIFDSSLKLFMDNQVLFNHKLFQHFGLDFILTKNGPKLLEINKDPNLTSHYLGNRDKEILMKELMLSQMYDIIRNDSLGIENEKNKIIDYLLIKKIENPNLLLNK
jgi:hypothetical protein